MYSPIPVKGRSHFGSNYWQAYSPKLGRDVNFYSDLEYDHWVLIETDCTIKRFCEQPLKINGRFAGKEVASIFDMWIEYDDGKQEFREVKYERDLRPSSPKFEDVMRQTTLQREWCLHNNFSYRIITDSEIRTGKTYLDNLKVMLPYLNSRNNMAETDCYKVIKVIRNGSTKINAIYKELDTLPKYKIRSILYYLIYIKRISTNIKEKSLNGETEVWLDGK
ncbi:TnsA endonuclease N-terminal domain-containing protein [Bacillaceae bacterium W0354]